MAEDAFVQRKWKHWIFGLCCVAGVAAGATLEHYAREWHANSPDEDQLWNDFRWAHHAKYNGTIEQHEVNKYFCNRYITSPGIYAFSEMLPDKCKMVFEQSGLEPIYFSFSPSVNVYKARNWYRTRGQYSLIFVESDGEEIMIYGDGK